MGRAATLQSADSSTSRQVLSISLSWWQLPVKIELIFCGQDPFQTAGFRNKLLYWATATTSTSCITTTSSIQWMSDGYELFSRDWIAKKRGELMDGWKDRWTWRRSPSLLASSTLKMETFHALLYGSLSRHENQRNATRATTTIGQSEWSCSLTSSRPLPWKAIVTSFNLDEDMRR